jgi:hypothetical protein
LDEDRGTRRSKSMAKATPEHVDTVPGPLIGFVDREPTLHEDAHAAAGALLERAGQFAAVYDAEGRCYVAVEVRVTQWQRVVEADRYPEEMAAHIASALLETADTLDHAFNGPAAIAQARRLLDALRQMDELDFEVQEAVATLEAAIAAATR